MAERDGHALGVDLGTSNTVAVLRWPDGRTRPLIFDGLPIVPSGVFLDADGRLHVGRDAQRLAQADPGRYEPNPKRRVDEPAVLLGDQEVPTADLLAGLLRAVAQAAVEAVGFLPPAVLSYPAAWGARRREVLATAVTRAGWPPVGVPGAPPAPTATLLVPEPVAAARYFADVLRRPVPVGSAIAVFDFGGGTLDIAVVRNEGVGSDGRARFAVIGSGGVAELGGLDLDAALVEHLGAVVGANDPQAWRQLSQPTTASQWRARRQFWDDVRGAKEMLSRAAVAPVPVPGVEQAVHLTREELERLAAPLLRRGVVEAASVIAACRLTPDQLAGLFLVGGSSRVPLVARLLHSELGVAPTVLEQPELPVAEGALTERVAPPSSAATARAAVSVPVQPGPLTGTVPAGVATTAGIAPTSGGTPSGPGMPIPGSGVPYPVSGAPGGGPVSPGAPPFPPGPGQPGAPTFPGGGPLGGTGPARSGLFSGRRFWLAAVAGVAALALVVTGAVWYLRGEHYSDLDFQAFDEIGRVQVGGERPSYEWTATSGDRAYTAVLREDQRLEITAMDASTGKKRWTVQTENSSEEWAGISALPDALVVFAKASGDSTPRAMTVLDPARGKQLWSHDIHGDDGVLFYSDTLVLLDRTAHRISGFGLRDGREKWGKDSPKDQYGGAKSAIYRVTTPADLGTPAAPSGQVLTPGDDDGTLVQIGADRSARVIQAGSGKILKSRTNVADPDDVVTAHDGKLYVAPTDGGYRLSAYDLATMGEPANLYSTKDENWHPKLLTPCGADRVCLLEAPNYDDGKLELVAVDTEKGGARWRRPAPQAEYVIPVGDRVMVRATSPKESTTVWRADGTKMFTEDGTGVRVDGGNLLLFAKALSSYEEDASVAGVPMEAGKAVQLGLLKQVRSESCSWNDSVITCGTDKDFVLWRFAKG